MGQSRQRIILFSTEKGMKIIKIGNRIFCTPENSTGIEESIIC